MSDPVALAIVAGLVTVVQGLFALLLARRTNHKVADVHTLVNDRSTRQDTKIADLTAEIARLQADPTSRTHPGPASAADPVGIVDGQVTTERRA
jgi:hypothetical protein